MRRLVAVVFAASLALVLVGCGGGGEEAAAPTDQAAAPAPVPAPAAASAAVSITDRSIPESSTFTPFPTGDFVPQDLAARVAAKQPTLLFFYDKDQKGTNDQRDEIDTVLDENRGLMDLVSYDIGKYSSFEASSGTAATDPALLKDPSLSKAVLLARALKVSYAPYIVIVDQQGYITYRARGFVDAGLLEPEVLRAAK